MNLFMVYDLFSSYVNATTSNEQGVNDMSPTMRQYYSMHLIDNAMPELVHDQFGQKEPIPKGNGKSVNFRKFDPLPKALTPLTEGVTPDGQALNMTKIECEVHQYGGYVIITDILDLTAVDNILLGANELLASQAGRTLDTVVREVLNGGSSVIYSGGKEARAALVGGDATAANNCYLTVDDIRKAVRNLKVMNAKKINGHYVAIIHPDASYDIKNDPKWEAVKDYDPEDWYEGEIGRIEGVRFVETTEAKVFHADDLIAGEREFAVNGAVSNSKSVVFDGNTGTVAADALKGRVLQFYDATNGWQLGEVASNTASSGTATITLKENITLADNAKIFPGEAGKEGRDVYSTLVLGANAYGSTNLEGGGLEYIFKGFGSGEDPLNQRQTSGWKATKAAIRLVEGYIQRIESASTFQVGAN